MYVLRVVDEVLQGRAFNVSFENAQLIVIVTVEIRREDYAAVFRVQGIKTYLLM
jgi:hypothetical protein